MPKSYEHGHGPMSYEQAGHLLNPLRKLILSPRKLVRRLDLRDDFKVLELGPGPGFFSLEIARSIPSGTLVLVDIQQEMLDMVKKRLAQAGISNVQLIRGDAAALPVAGASFDVAILASVLGEVPEKAGCIKELYRILRPQGLLPISSF